MTRLFILLAKYPYCSKHLAHISTTLCKLFQTRDALIIGTDKVLRGHTHPSGKITENGSIGMLKSVIGLVPEGKWDRHYHIWTCGIMLRLKEVGTEPAPSGRIGMSDQTNVHDKSQATNIFWRQMEVTPIHPNNVINCVGMDTGSNMIALTG